MAGRRVLNGLPHNIAQSYFSHAYERYYKGGNVAEWLYHTARRNGISEVTIDVLEVHIEPVALQILPLKVHLQQVRLLFESHLQTSGFPLDFIKELKIRVEIPSNKTDIFCYPHMLDREGRKYVGKRLSVYIFNPRFDPYAPKPSILEKLFSLFRGQ